MSTKSIWVFLSGLLLIACACRKSGSSASGAPDASGTAAPVVVGTVIDAATGEPVSGARVEAPDKKHAKTNRDGRFEITDLTAGTEGDLTVKLDDGRAGHVHLRRLVRGPPLEVVLQVSRP
jgi:hypothetical protein